MNLQNHSPSLPQDLEDVFTGHALDHEALLKAFMPVFCDHLQADRIFLQPRNPKTRVCKILRWRRNEDIPWYGETEYRTRQLPISNLIES